MIPTSKQVALYRSLFRGRDDCYARFWEKNGRSGYSPAYSLNWQEFKKHRGRYAPIVLIYGTRVQFSKLPKYIEASVSPVRYKQTMEWSPEAKPFVPLIE